MGFSLRTPISISYRARLHPSSPPSAHIFASLGSWGLGGVYLAAVWLQSRSSSGLAQWSRLFCSFLLPRFASFLLRSSIGCNPVARSCADPGNSPLLPHRLGGIHPFWVPCKAVCCGIPLAPSLRGRSNQDSRTRALSDSQHLPTHEHDRSSTAEVAPLFVYGSHP